MSIRSVFQSNKSALRRGGIALATVASLFAANAGHASDFTTDECRVVDAVAREVVRAVGKETLSVPFLQSYVNWRGADYTCDGPQITATTRDDVVAWTTIRGLLAVAERPIDLQARGVQPVYAPAAASLQSNQPG